MKRNDNGNVTRRSQKDLPGQEYFWSEKCEYCGSRRTGRETIKNRFCSGKCRQAAYRARERAKVKGEAAT